MEGFFKLDDGLFVARNVVESILVDQREMNRQKEYALILYFKEEIRVGESYTVMKYHTGYWKTVQECFDYLEGKDGN